MATYKINEIFSSLQGEGFNTGRPVVFVRFATCNLLCNWCDTNCLDYEVMDLEDILDCVEGFELKSVIITGGEPTIHENMPNLVKALKEKGYWVALETNGIIGLNEDVQSLFDYVVVSPKSHFSSLYEKESAAKKADEVRIVVDGNIIDFCDFIEKTIVSKKYYLSPCCGINDEFNVLQAIKLLGQLNMRENKPEWLLSFQTHKLANIQ